MWETIQNGIGEVWNGITGAFNNITEYLTKIWDTVDTAKELVKAMPEEIQTGMGAIITAITILILIKAIK